MASKKDKHAVKKGHLKKPEKQDKKKGSNDVKSRPKSKGGDQTSKKGGEGGLAKKTSRTHPVFAKSEKAKKDKEKQDKAEAAALAKAEKAKKKEKGAKAAAAFEKAEKAKKNEKEAEEREKAKRKTKEKEEAKAETAAFETAEKAKNEKKAEDRETAKKKKKEKEEAKAEAAAFEKAEKAKNDKEAEEREKAKKKKKEKEEAKAEAAAFEKAEKAKNDKEAEDREKAKRKKKEKEEAKAEAAAFEKAEKAKNDKEAEEREKAKKKKEKEDPDIHFEGLNLCNLKWGGFLVKWPFRWFIPHFAGISPANKSLLIPLRTFWLTYGFCFQICAFRSCGGGLWWLERARSLEVACTRPLSWCLYFYMYFACFCSNKKNKKIQPRKNPGNRQEHPKNRREPPWIFFDLDHSEVQRFFPFSDVCLCEMAMETKETFEALLVGLKAEGVPPTAKTLAEASGLSERKEKWAACA